MKKENQSSAEILRQKAEELIKNKLPIAAALKTWMPEAEALRIIHELEVHQIELELQNEELHRALTDAETAKNKFTDLYDFAPSGYFTLSIEGDIIGLNLTGAKMLGNERSHLQNRHFALFVSKDTRPVFSLFLEKIFYSKIQETCEVKLLNNGDMPLFVLLIGIVTKNEKQCNITAVDITDRTLAENKLLAEQSFRNSIEFSLRSGIAIVDDEGRQIYVNPFFCELVGWNEEDLLEKNAPFVYWPPDQLQAIGEAFRLTLAGNAPKEGFELEFVRKDGVRFPAQVIISPFTNGKQRTGWLANVIDVTVRRQTEETLKESENRSRSFIEAIPDLIFMLDSEGVYLDFKADGSDLAYQKESILGKKNRDMMPPDFADLIDEKIKLTLQTGKTQVFEYQLDLPQKGICYFEARMVQCGTNSVMAIVRNITERKISDVKIQQINEQLTELNATKDKFFNIIAHDLKSPFNSIVGFSELLVEMVNDKDYNEMGKYAGIIQQSSHRAIDLLMNLMEWARSQTGRMEFNPEFFEMDALINDVVELLSDHAAQKSITISKKLPARGIVKADKAMISTVLRNLIANAIKFTRRGGEIIISVDENQYGLTVAVKDNGIGIPANIIGKLFRLDENFTTHGTENEQGTGLGLILCKEFIEKHHGKIQVKSIEGKGSTFSFSIPVN
jgi:two-component system sensor histidine kinase/response regulator